MYALREEGDLELERGLLRFKLFLSTPSARRATRHPAGRITTKRFLSTPSARRATNILLAQT